MIMTGDKSDERMMMIVVDRKYGSMNGDCCCTQSVRAREVMEGREEER